MEEEKQQLLFGPANAGGNDADALTTTTATTATTTKAAPATPGPRPHARRSRSRLALPCGRGAAAVLVCLLLLSALVHPAVRCRSRLSQQQHPPAHSLTRTLEQRAAKILSENPLIDGHDDLPILIREVYGNHIYERNFTERFENGTLPGHVDLPRLRAGHNGGAFWSVFVPCPAAGSGPSSGSDFADDIYADSVRATLEQIDLMHRLQGAYPWDFSRAEVDSRAAMTAFRRQGRFISPLAVEGLHQIGNSAANLRHYAARGVRYATLTHNCGNAYADAALREVSGGRVEPAPSHWGGVSQRGRDMVREMNRLGVMVDLAHVSADTMVDVLGGRPDVWPGSRAPVLFSHSSAHALCPHPRNVPDDVLRLVQKTDSVVMVNFSPDFISCASPSPSPSSSSSSSMPGPDPAHPATLARVADHITHIGSLIGYAHVGIGSDFDGIGATPLGLEDASRMPALFAELLRRGVSESDAAAVAGGNVLRVWRAAEDVAARMREEGVPVLEDGVPGAVLDDAAGGGAGAWP